MKERTDKFGNIKSKGGKQILAAIVRDDVGESGSPESILTDETAWANRGARRVPKPGKRARKIAANLSKANPF